MVAHRWRLLWRGGRTVPHLSECSKGCIFTRLSHERWSVFDDHTPRIPPKLGTVTAKGDSDGDVDQPSTQLFDLPFTTLRVWGDPKDIVQSTPFQEPLEIE